MVNTDQMQVEETLNNSNDLFLTFRKEMEEMSKKTKRLEKENQNLQRHKDITNRNIGEMVEERHKKTREAEEQRKKIARLETLCRGMQAQGRGQVPMHELEHEEHEEEDEEVTESEYEYEDEDSAEYDDDTEEDGVEPAPERRPFGPVPPPPPPQPQPGTQGKVNGHKQVNGQMNGVKR